MFLRVINQFISAKSKRAGMPRTVTPFLQWRQSIDEFQSVAWWTTLNTTLKTIIGRETVTKSHDLVTRDGRRARSLRP